MHVRVDEAGEDDGAGKLDEAVRSRRVADANAFDVTFNSVENSNPPILSFQTQAVPEPSTLATLAIGAVGLLAYLRGSGNELRSAADSGHFAGTTRPTRL